ncbi:MAG: YkvA family protein [Chloroflexota bacterium]
MAAQRRPQNSEQTFGFLKDLIQQGRLLWRLLHDPRVPGWVKAIPAAVLIYLFFPIDLLPDPALGLGQLDDLAVVLLGLKLFRDFSPRAVVREHEANMAGESSPWQVVEPEAPSPAANASYIDAEYRLVESDPDENSHPRPR